MNDKSKELIDQAVEASEDMWELASYFTWKVVTSLEYTNELITLYSRLIKQLKEQNKEHYKKN